MRPLWRHYLLSTHVPSFANPLRDDDDNHRCIMCPCVRMGMRRGEPSARAQDRGIPPLFSGTEVLVPNTEGEGVADAMIEAAIIPDRSMYNNVSRVYPG